MTPLRRHIFVTVALLLVASGCGSNADSSDAAVDVCQSLAEPAPIGAVLFSELPVATVKSLYPNVRGLDRFLRTVGSSNTVVTCAFDGVASSPCEGGDATYLVTTDGRHKFTMPCGVAATPPGPRS